MIRKPIFIAFIVLALVILACRININIPVDKITTGPTQTEKIEVAAPDASVVDLTLAFGAGDLEISPGAEDALVTGTATYNVQDFKPKVTVDNASVKIETGDLDIHGIPKFSGDIKNKWDLKLADTPMNLVISAGAYQGEIDLGGLSVKSLEVNDGAATTELDFSKPNPIEMESLRYSTGASTVSLHALANANFTSMIFRSGAGDYKLDFSGELKRDSVVTIESGISQVTIVIPKGVSAKLIFNGELTNVDISGGWEKSGDSYTLSGSGPTLTINVDMAAGNLVLRTGS
jgi:hypothetical protein